MDIGTEDDRETYITAPAKEPVETPQPSKLPEIAPVETPTPEKVPA